MHLARYIAEFSILYPAALLCYLPLSGFLRLRIKALCPLVLSVVTAFVLLGSAVCMRFQLKTNALLLPMMAPFMLLYVKSVKLPLPKALFVFFTASMLTAFSTSLTNYLCAPIELHNSEPVFALSSGLICLAVSLIVLAVFSLLFRRTIHWMLCNVSFTSIWRALFAAPLFLTVVFIWITPWSPSVVLTGRVREISVVLLIIFLSDLFWLYYFVYLTTHKMTEAVELQAQNQLLGMENARYRELRVHMDTTRQLRHDFRQHLHVIAGLTEAGQLEELKNYLCQYESELSEERPTLCANPAVDALAGHYDHEARQLGVPVEWRLELPRQLPVPEADLCMMLGNLLENAFHASQKLPPEQRQVKVMARMLSPAMLGLLVENRYDGVLKHQKGALHSTKHDGMGIGLVSIQTTAAKYGGSMTVETENGLFRVNILLNL